VLAFFRLGSSMPLLNLPCNVRTCPLKLELSWWVRIVEQHSIASKWLASVYMWAGKTAKIWAQYGASCLHCCILYQIPDNLARSRDTVLEPLQDFTTWRWLLC